VTRQKTAPDATQPLPLVALRPGDAYDAMLAAQILACEVSAAECLCLVARPDVETATSRRGHSPAASMKKLTQSEFRDLQRRPAEHEKSGRATRRRFPAPNRAARIPALDLRVVEHRPRFTERAETLWPCMLRRQEVKTQIPQISRDVRIWCARTADQSDVSQHHYSLNRRASF
jgi:hypothetical protein